MRFLKALDLTHNLSIFNLVVLSLIFETKLESSISIEKTWLAEATTGGGKEFENR